MDTHQLLGLVRQLPANTPLHKDLERQIQIGVGYGRAWYASQKQHWIRWLSEYSSPGPYNRKPTRKTPAQLVYNRLMCPPMVFWLAEASGVPDRHLLAAIDCAIRAGANCARRSAAIRKVIPWDQVHSALELSSPENDRKQQSDFSSTSATRST